jgi:hypothetical protein
MENKINIAELLKDCPEGMKLYSPIFGDVYLDKIRPHLAIVVTTDKEQGNIKEEFLYDGRYGMNGECMLFPSKGKTTWKGFHRPFKDGDIIYVRDEYSDVTFTYVAILKQIEKGGEINSHCFYNYEDDVFNTNNFLYDSYNIRFATEEEKQKLFDAIKANGYKWNAKTKTLEKLTESKEDVDDEILMSGIYFDRKYHADEVELHLGNYEIEIRDGRTYAVLKNQKTKTFELPKFKVGDEIKQIGSDRHYIIKNIEFDRYILNNNQFIRFTDEHIYELAPNKLVEPNFNVGDEIKYKYPTADTSTLTIIKVECDKNRYVVCDKPNNFAFLSFFSQDNFNFISKTKFDITTLVPFESRVLVRDNDYDVWRVAFWGYLREKQDIKYDTTRGVFRQCIPYECNEHLLGKTEDCTEYFKTW